MHQGPCTDVAYGRPICSDRFLRQGYFYIVCFIFSAFKDDAFLSMKITVYAQTISLGQNVSTKEWKSWEIIAIAAERMLRARNT